MLAETLSDRRTLLAVADGMGGHAAGEVASALALQTLTEAISDGQSLEAAFTLANSRVHEMAAEPGKQGMGTTLVAILADGGSYEVANVGDSRAYVISASGIRRLTEDHSFVAEAMKRGQTEEEAMATPWRDALTRSIGTDEEVRVDVFGPFEVEADSAFLICSDGLYKTLSDQDLQDLFARSGSPRGAAQALVSAAFDNGSDDNISAAVAEWGEVPRQAVSTTMVMKALTPDAEPAPAPGGTSTAEEAPPEGTFGGADDDAEVVTAESSLVGGLPLGALAAVVLVVGALVAILLFGG